MAEIYRSVDSEGRVTYGSSPPTSAGKLDILTPNGRRDIPVDNKPPLTHDQVKDIIKAVQQVTPHLPDYLEFLSFSRRYDPHGFKWVMRKLKQQDPLMYEKLLKYPELRSLGQSAFNIKSVEKNLSFATGVAGGSYTGSMEKWLATTVKDYMKERRWGIYAADVLGSKASTLPAPKAPTYSNTRFGQYMKVDDARAAKAGKEAGKAWEDGRAAVRTAAGTALTRATKPGLDVMTSFLDADRMSDAAAFRLNRLIESLHGKGIISPEEAAQAQNLLSEGKIAELDQYLKSLQKAYLRGER